MKSDAQKINDMGGPAKVAEMLGYDPKKGPQRVSNWRVRGIPPSVRIEHLDLFGPPPARSTQQEAA